MGNFNLNKNEEEGKKERFSLNKSPETSPEPEKKDRFSLNKGEGVSTTTTEKKDRFSLNKGQEAQNTSPEKKVNLSPNEGSETSANALEEVAGHTADKSVAPVATVSDFTKLKKEILADGKIDKDEVDRLRKELYSDGKIDEEEANFLFELNDAVGEKKNDPSWNQFFVTAITDYLLKDEKSPGVIDEEEGKWLVERIGSDGKVDGVEKQLLDNLKKNAKRMPKTVADLAAGKAVTHAAPASNLTKLKKEILADGKIDKDEVDRLRKELYSDGKIDEEEANFLFELNDAVGEKKNDPSWNQFFVTAISDYLLKDEKSPGIIDEEEGKWLVEKIGSDGKVDGVEKQLLDNLKKNAKKMPEIVEALAAGKAVTHAAPASNLTKLKKEILADGKIDKDEVDRLRKELYSDGKIDEEEANFLFELNDAVSEKKNDPSWNQFFVTAISDYLLKDEKSPGVIDDEEGKWLVEKIGSDGKVDGVEKLLLDNLKKNAKKMPKNVEALAVGKTVALAAQASNLTKLKKEILADGKIDKDEVDRLRKELYSDGKIDEEEANFLFELNDAVSEKKNDPSWNQFFVTAISDYLLRDEKSPGVIDEEEGKWLVEKIGSDGKVDGVEKLLLDNLKKNAKKMPKNVEALANSQPLTNGIKNKEVGNDDTRKSHKWIWWLIILILIIALIVVIMRNCKSDNSLSNNKQVDPMEQQDTNSQEEPTPNGDTIEGTENNNIAQDIPVGQSESESSGKVASNENNQVAITNNKPLSEKDRGSAVIKQNDKPISVEKGKPIAQKTTDVRNYSQNPIDLSDKTVEELAKAVIRGNYGNGVDRKRALGDRYSEIQQRVNEIYRERGL